MQNTEINTANTQDSTQANVSAQVETKARKAKKVVSAGKLTRLLAIGSRGTAFAQLSEEQIAAVKLNSKNGIFEKTHRTFEQLKARNSGKHQGVLWADSCSWIQSRNEGDSFWLGALESAIKAGLVKKAIVTLDDGKKVTGYMRANYNTEHSLSKVHKCIAVDTELGRIETTGVGCGEKKKTRKVKNQLFVRGVEKLEIK